MSKKAPIIILHGWGLSGKKFSGLAKEFEKKGYTVYAPDLPGFGSAAVPSRPYDLSDYAAFLRTFCEKNNIDRPILLGHSFGGRVVLRYTSEHEKDVTAVILSGTPGYSPVKQWKWIFSWTIAKIGNICCSLPIIRTYQERIRAWYYWVIGARDFYRANGVMRQTFKLVIQDSLEKYMVKIHVPTLLLWGQDDILVPVSIATHMNKTIGSSVLQIVPHADHCIPYVQPEVFATHADRWLKSL